ncbi:unnamed protein product, partial [Closterium sp. NIES-53]
FLHHHRSNNTKMRLMLKTNKHRHHLLLPPLIIKSNSSGSHHRLHHNNDNNHLHPIYLLLFNPLLLTSRTSSNSNILPTLTLSSLHLHLSSFIDPGAIVQQPFFTFQIIVDSYHPPYSHHQHNSTHLPISSNSLRQFRLIELHQKLILNQQHPTGLL